METSLLIGMISLYSRTVRHYSQIIFHQKILYLAIINAQKLKRLLPLEY